jgi:hypothetical protein
MRLNLYNHEAVLAGEEPNFASASFRNRQACRLDLERHPVVDLRKLWGGNAASRELS